MKNLSKVLALVLALALTMTMFAGATVVDYKGYSDDTAMSAAGKEAVAVLSALGVINGYPDGEYKPANFVTRAEFAKMITVAKTADPAASFYSVSALSFKDTAGHWALNYLNYVSLNEIMVGYGDGTAKPDANVTGAEAIKMTLVALGYEPKVEGLEGSAWISNTVSLASRIGLLKNLESANLYAAFTREQNAILISNAIYSKTVTYVADNYVAKDVTLGVEVFDLLDITGVLVANDLAALGANWTNVLNELGNTNLVNSYVLYNKAAADQAVFVYRDYTGASTVGGYYVPRAVTVNLKSIEMDSSFGDLGKAYRVLTTGAKTPFNTTEVRKVYGILWETADNYVSATKQINALTKANVQAMLDSAKKTDVTVTGASKQFNIFINGVAATYDAAIALAGNLSTAPFRYVDNNNDGIWDSLFINTYTLGKVAAVTEDSYTVIGVGTFKKAVATVVTADYTPAVGDYVAYYKNNDSDRYIVKLDVVTDRVTGFDGSKKFTIAGSAYSFGSLVAQADEAGFKDLMGAGYSSVNGPILKYTMDGPYIVLVESVGATSFEEYGIVIGYNLSTVLGLGQIRILNDDNEYKDYFITSVNGKQQYNQVVDPEANGDLPSINTLVAYIVNGNYISLYFYDGASSNGFALLNGGQYSEEYDFSYNNLQNQQDTWYGTPIGSHNIWNTPFKNENGVVFVSYGWLLNGRSGQGDGPYSGYPGQNIQYAAPWTLQWKAYKTTEFQPNYFTAADEVGSPSNVDGFEDVVVYASNINGMNLIKAAAITFDNEYEFSLPGLPVRAGLNFYGTVMGASSVAYDSEKGVYNYTFSILEPMSTAGKTVTVQSSVYAMNTFQKGFIYKFFADADGIVRRWEDVTEYSFQTWNDGLDVGGSGSFPYFKFYITAAHKNPNGTYTLYIKSPDDFFGPAPDPDMEGHGGPTDNWIFTDFNSYELTLTVPADADIYFVKNLFDPANFAAADYAALPAWGSIFGDADGKFYEVYADINPSTLTVNSLWVDTVQVNKFDLNLRFTLDSYDESTGNATYRSNNYINFANGSNTLVINQKPWELFLNEGQCFYLPTVVSLHNDGYFYIESISSRFAAPVLYQLPNAQNFKILDTPNVGSLKGQIEVYTTGSGGEPDVDYDIGYYTQIWWVHGNGQISPMAAKPSYDGLVQIGDNNATVKTNFYADLDTALLLLEAGPNYQYGGTNGPLNYEQAWVVENDDGVARILVLVDTSTGLAPVEWPYVEYALAP